MRAITSDALDIRPIPSTPLYSPDRWQTLSEEDRFDVFQSLARGEASELFLSLTSAYQEALIGPLPVSERRVWLRLLAPDDAADVIQLARPDERDDLLGLLVPRTRIEVEVLLEYQADATLVIRAMALGEIRLRDWWRVVRREIGFGLGLGAILATLGAVRITVWQGLFGSYGDHAFELALTVSLSLIGVVAWGTIVGSMIPLALRRAGLDPANASAPFVATLCDVTGLVIYFSIAKLILLNAV